MGADRDQDRAIIPELRGNAAWAVVRRMIKARDVLKDTTFFRVKNFLCVVCGR
jgi:hypothetical protein